MQRTVLAFVLLGLAGCTDDPEPVAYSEPISVRLSGIKEGDVRDGEAARDKGVDEESGNPYHEFLRQAQARLAGIPPSAIRPTSVTVQLGADSTGAVSIGDVFATLEVFVSDGTTTIPIGAVNAPAGSSVSIPIAATLDTLDPIQESMLDGHIRVGVRGRTVVTPPAQFDLRLTVDVVFEALP